MLLCVLSQIAYEVCMGITEESKILEGMNFLLQGLK